MAGPGVGGAREKTCSYLLNSRRPEHTKMGNRIPGIVLLHSGFILLHGDTPIRYIYQMAPPLSLLCEVPYHSSVIYHIR